MVSPSGSTTKCGQDIEDSDDVDVDVDVTLSDVKLAIRDDSSSPSSPPNTESDKDDAELVDDVDPVLNNPLHPDRDMQVDDETDDLYLMHGG